jgi:uncharacterized glyoxalase superfamily protein PhnB
VSPVNCTEGDPFAEHESLYWKEALAAKALLHHTAPGKSTHHPATAKANATGLHAETHAAGSKVPAGQKLTAKQLEEQEVKSEAISLEKADAAIAASIYDHSKPVSSKAAARAGQRSSAEKLLNAKARVTQGKARPLTSAATITKADAMFAKAAPPHVAAPVSGAQPRPEGSLGIPAAAG